MPEMRVTEKANTNFEQIVYEPGTYTVFFDGVREGRRKSGEFMSFYSIAFAFASKSLEGKIINLIFNVRKDENETPEGSLEITYSIVRESSLYKAILALTDKESFPEPFNPLELDNLVDKNAYFTLTIEKKEKQKKKGEYYNAFISISKKKKEEALVNRASVTTTPTPENTSKPSNTRSLLDDPDL